MDTVESWVVVVLPSQGGEAMNIKDAIIIMIMFATFVIALLSYIAVVSKL